MTFRLPTPSRIGVGLRVNEFRPPEQESWSRSAALNGESFARGHHFFDHYSDMQQRAQLLVPALPVHSRVDELNRVWAQKLHHEVQREASLAALRHNESVRLERLQQTKGLLRSGIAGRTLQQACSLPSLVPPAFGSATPAMELMNRRVDVNRLRRTQQTKARPTRDLVKARDQELGERLDEVIHDLCTFEHANLLEVEAMRTTTDWSFKMPRLASVARGAEGGAGRRDAVAPSPASPSPASKVAARRAELSLSSGFKARHKRSCSRAAAASGAPSGGCAPASDSLGGGSFAFTLDEHAVHFDLG